MLFARLQSCHRHKGAGGFWTGPSVNLSRNYSWFIMHAHASLHPGCLVKLLYNTHVVLQLAEPCMFFGQVSPDLSDQNEPNVLNCASKTGNWKPGRLINSLSPVFPTYFQLNNFHKTACMFCLKLVGQQVLTNRTLSKA